jgi:hypothetical protein
MADWNLKYETGFKVHKKEENYILETINDFVELTNAEHQILQEIILKNRENRLRG